MQITKTLILAALTILVCNAPCRAQQVRGVPNQAFGAAQSGLARNPPPPHAAPPPFAPNAAPGPQVQGNDVAAATDGLVVGAVLVDGAPEIDPAAFMPVIAPFIGRPLHQQDLQDLLSIISGVARAQGYALCHSAIPAQTFRAGVLKVALDLGRIDRIDLLGTQSNAVRAVLAPLVGKPARQPLVERQLMLASDIPGILIGDVSYIRDGSQSVLRVEVRHQSAAVHLAIDNRGNSALGPLRMALAYDLNGILGDERVSSSGQVMVTPLHPHELASTTVRLAYVLDDAGTDLEVSASVSHTHPGGNLAALGYAGQTRELAVAINHPLLRNRTASLWIGADVDYLALDQHQGAIPLWRDRATLLGLTLSGYGPVAHGRLRAGVTARALLSLPGMTQPADPLASRPGAGSGAHFVNVWGNWEGPLAGPFSARLAINGQLSDAPLPIAQQLAIGGLDFGRAYDYAERTGDKGALGSMELQYKVPARMVGTSTAMMLYGFADAGYVANLTSTPGNGSLVSAGFGTRITMPRNVHLGLELAFPVNQPRFDSDTYSPRLSVNLGTSF